MENIEYVVSRLRLLEKENSKFLHLTANENQLSKMASSFLASKLSERYYFGSGNSDKVIDFGTYTFRGLPVVEELVSLASTELKKMTGAKSVNLNCFSGLHAMMCTILVSTKPGDTVMSIPFEDGGHAATKGIIENLGRKHVFAKFDRKTFDLDIKQTTGIFKESGANAFYIDISAHLNPINVKKIRKALGKHPVIIYDASHCFGLILGQVLKSPLRNGANIVCTNTHKTFAGPQGGLILFNDVKFGKEASFKIDSSLVSSVHTARLMALSLSLLEYSRFGKTYAKQVIANSNALGKALEKKGYKLRKINKKTYSRNEQVHLFLPFADKRIVYYKWLIKNNISTNFMQILDGGPFARLGVQEVTRRGMKEREMEKIANFIDAVFHKKNIKKEIIEFNRRFPNVEYSFDKTN